MQFLYPTFLFALAALAIPIIIHLFYFRRFKKVYFTNVRFLKEVKEETSARSKLRNLLVLLMRLLAIAFLVFAFAQPFLPAKNAAVKKGSKAVSVFIDNSFSMKALSSDVPLIEKAKQRAREIVEAYPVDARFQVLTNDFEGRHQRLYSKDEALNLVEEIKISPAVKKLSSVLGRQKQTLNSGDADNRTIYLLSDFQRNITDLENEADTTIEINLLPLQAVRENNVGIDSAWFEAPVQMLNQLNTLLVRVRNYTNEDAENIRLSMLYTGENKPVGTMNIPAKSFVIDTINLTVLKPGWQNVTLNITDYPIQFDDKYFLSFLVAEQINVLAINDLAANPNMEAAFRGFGNYVLTNATSNQLDYSKMSGYQLIVLNELTSISTGLAFELQQFVKNGGNLLVFPNKNATIASYRSFLSGFPADELERFEETAKKVSYINTDEFIFHDVYENKSANFNLPSTTGSFRLSSYQSRKAEPLLTFRDGEPYLSKYQVEQGNLYLCASPLNTNFNDLVRNGEIFVPLLYKTAISSGQTRPVAYTIGKDEQVSYPITQAIGNETVYKLKGKAEEFIPEQRIIGARAILGVHQQIPDAGFYELFLTPEEKLYQYAFNYDRQESDLEYYSGEDLENIAGPTTSVIDITDEAYLTQTIAERSQGIVLWRWCIIAVLIFLGLEVLLLRFWKV
ncbi:MAG: BatA domain-containing protein [Saprospiraceae bacterium]|nr:BatA domain-containing protein [Saprospiraceae bacterium]MCB9325912.1 BatA domain-containing protein [Lewinellaceae bacterium]